MKDRNAVLNRLAEVIEQEMGDPVNSEVGAPPRGPWMPLSVRHRAAEAAVAVVEAWWKAEPDWTNGGEPSPTE